MRRLFHVVLLTGLFLLLTVVVSACGSTSSTSTSSSYGGSTATPTATSSASASPTATVTYSSGSGYNSASVVIKTASATVNGKTKTILTNAEGMTLYYFTSDTKTTAACADGCATSWPPVLVTGSSEPTSTTTLPGKLTVQKSANGMQVQYNGHFLYTFSGDTAAGQTNGEGIGGKWFVATSDLS